jgi:hypothetical protein
VDAGFALTTRGVVVDPGVIVRLPSAFVTYEGNCEHVTNLPPVGSPPDGPTWHKASYAMTGATMLGIVIEIDRLLPEVVPQFVAGEGKEGPVVVHFSSLT